MYTVGEVTIALIPEHLKWKIWPRVEAIESKDGLNTALATSLGLTAWAASLASRALKEANAQPGQPPRS